MQDREVRDFEHSLWVGDAANYEAKMDSENVVIVVPTEPFVMNGRQAIDAVENTPRWSEAELSNLTIARPQHGLIVLAYHARARRDGDEAEYEAWCTSTYRRLDDEEWRVVQHSQMVPPSA